MDEHLLLRRDDEGDALLVEPVKGGTVQAAPVDEDLGDSGAAGREVALGLAHQPAGAERLVALDLDDDVGNGDLGGQIESYHHLEAEDQHLHNLRASRPIGHLLLPLRPSGAPAPAGCLHVGPVQHQGNLPGEDTEAGQALDGLIEAGRGLPEDQVGEEVGHHLGAEGLRPFLVLASLLLRSPAEPFFQPAGVEAHELHG
nr:hypothetical protein [Limnochorda pilosa]